MHGLLYALIEVEKFNNFFIVESGERPSVEGERRRRKENVLRHMPCLDKAVRIGKVPVFDARAMPHAGEYDENGRRNTRSVRTP